MSIEIILVLVFFTSAFTMSFAGFGFAVISVPLLALFFPIKEAVALQFPYCLILFLYQAWHYRKHFQWAPMIPLLLGTVIGLSLGTFVLYQLPENFLKRLLALFIVFVVIFNLSQAGKQIKLTRCTPWFGRLCGFISGSFLGAYNLGGPAIVLYFRTITDNPLEAKSFMASFFSVLFILLAFFYGATGFLTAQTLTHSALFAPAVALGSLFGFWAFQKVSSRMYNRVIDLMLLAISVVLWVRM